MSYLHRFLLAIVLILGTLDLQADEGTVRGHFGAFSTEVPIEIPKFRDLEPDLKLVYSSGRSNSWLGKGWTLSGVSMIERGRPLGGSPTYDDSLDAFFLDGSEMIECETQGGTHCTRIQNYARIVHEPGEDRWLLYGTNGHKATFEAGIVTDRGTFRWLLSRIEDAFGNKVDYEYSCDDGRDCYPYQILYNGTVITFKGEARPDPASYARGGDLGVTDYRARSITVEVSGEMARAYELRYETSAASGASILVEVQQFGNDAEVELTGEITGGTALPPMRLGWRQPPADVDTAPFDFQRSLPGASTATNSFLNSHRDVIVGDWNGDGAADMLHLHAGSDPQHSWVALSHGDGTFDFQRRLPGASADTNSYLNNYREIYVGDWNGDGLSDILHLEPHANAERSWVGLANGDGTFDFQRSLPGASTSTNSYLTTSHRDLYTGDWNADGFTDLLHLHPNADPQYSWVALSNGDGTFDFQRRLPGADPSTNSYFPGGRRILVGDWDGDGATDLAYLHNNSHPQYSWVALSNGDGTFDFQRRLPGADTSTSSYISSSSSYHIQIGDWNGDGKSDLFYLHPHSNSIYSWVALSNGDGTFDFQQSLPGAGTSTNSYIPDNSQRTIHTGDWNGDGLADLLHHQPSTDPKYSWVAFSKGDGTFDFQRRLPGAGTSTNSYLGDNRYVLAADWDGDGTTDLGYLHNNANAQYSWIALSRHRMSDLVETIDNGLGGLTTLDWVPSSQWQNAMMPYGFIVPTLEALTVEDGRGGSSTTAFHYEGGLWSPDERRFLGFRQVSQVLDAQGTVSETFYVQRLGSLSKPETTRLLSASGQVYRRTDFIYTENESPPYSSLLTEKWDSECNLTNNCRQLLTQFAYDEYANVIATYEHGDFERDGDERTTVRGYMPNVDRYITGMPAYENVYEGIGIDGALMRQTLYRYDGNASHDEPPRIGKVTTLLEWLDTLGTYATTEYEYDVYGNVTRTTDARGALSVTGWDDEHHVFPVLSCNALSHCVDQVWDPVLGVPLFATDPNGAITEYRYDPFGRQVATVDALGQISTTEYLDWGDPTTQRVRSVHPDGTDDGLWSESYQDGLGRIVKVESEGGIVRQTEYVDASSRVAARSLPYLLGDEPQWSTTTYDGAGRVLAVANPDSTSSTMFYGNDLGGRPFVATTDEMGRERVAWHDGLGRMTQIREAEGIQHLYTTHTYDALDRLVRTIDALEHVATIEWDSLGRKILSEDFDAGRKTFTYDPGGLLLSQTDARGETIHYGYDLAGRPTTKSSTDGTTTWTYDQTGFGSSIGRLTSVSYPHGSESHSWDLMGRDISTTRCIRATCRTLERAYDAVGRVEALTFPDGESVIYRYGAEGRLASIDGYLDAAEWSPSGRPTRLELANGTEARYTYSPTREWLEHVAIEGSTHLLFEGIFAYDDVGRVISATRWQSILPGAVPGMIFADGFESGDLRSWQQGGGGPSPTLVESQVDYTYDDLGRLLSVSGDRVETFTYDAIGNVTWADDVGSLVYDDPSRAHAATLAGNRVLTYDAAGNVVDDGQRLYGWNAEGRLAEIEGAATFLYDANGSRLEKSNATGTDEYFFNELERIDGEWVRHIMAGSLLIARRGDDGTSWIHTDRLGSVRAMTNADGEPVRTLDYDSRGAILGDSGGPASSRAFAGHSVDRESGLVYMGARYYDPELGRFLSPDPVMPDPVDPQALNRYAYALNNPVSQVDPLGHAPVVAAVASVAGVVFANAPTWVVVTSVVGAGMSIGGYYTKDPVLSSIGGILLGFSGGFAMGGGQSVFGGLLGASAAAATSPISPLSPDVKQVIGWAYTGYGLIKGWTMADQQLPDGLSPKLKQTLLDLRDGRAVAPTDLSLLAKELDIPVHELLNVKQRVERLTDTLRAVDSQLAEGLQNEWTRSAVQKFFGGPAHRAASQRLVDLIGGEVPINIADALLLDPSNGMVGPTGFAFDTGGWLGLHGIFHDANGLSHRFVANRGFAMCPLTCGLFPSSKYSGQVFGITRQFTTFYHGYYPIF